MSENIQFFVPRVPMRAQQELEAKDFTLAPMQMGGLDGVLVHTDDLDEVLAHLGWTLRESHPTDMEGVFFADCRSFGSSGSTTQVQIGHWEGKASKRFARVAEVLLEVLGKKVCLRVPHGNWTEVRTDGVFYIHFWSSPQGTKVLPPPPTIWGQPVPLKKDKCFAPSGQGTPIIDSETSFCVAELVGDNLFVHYDMVHFGSEEELIMFARLVEEVCFLFPSNLPEDLQAQFLTRTEDPFVELMMGRPLNELDQLREEIEAHSEEAARIERVISHHLQFLLKKQEELKELDQASDDAGEYAGEYALLSANALIDQLWVWGSLIHILTPMITVEEEGVVYEMGRYFIVARLGQEAKYIRFYNLEHRRDGIEDAMHHPHVYGGGNACYGDAENALNDALSSLQLFQVIYQLVSFLASVNTDDKAGKFVSRWPVVDAPVETS